MNSSKKGKTQYQKNDFSDSEIEDEIADDVRRIREKDINQVAKQQEIWNIYNKQKEQKKRRKILFDD